MKHIPRLLVAFSVFLSGAALVPFVGLPTEGYRWQVYADAYQPMLIESNYETGMPGSFFTIAGYNFPPNDEVMILVNATVLGPIATDSTGDFVFMIDTAGADPGYYFVKTDEPNSPTTRLRLNKDDPLHVQEGEGIIFTLPTGIAYTLIHLPIIFH